MKKNAQNRRLFEKTLRTLLMKWKNHELPVESVALSAEEVASLELVGVNLSLFSSSNEDTIAFPRDLDAKYRKTVHEIASSVGLFHVSAGECASRFITVSRASTLQDSGLANLALEEKSQWYDETVEKPRVKHYFFSLTEEQKQLHATALSQARSTACITRQMSKLLLSREDLLSRGVASSQKELALNFTFIQTKDDLSALASKLSSASLLAFDCEMHNHRSYYGITCLMQLASDLDDEVYLVDTLSCWDSINECLGGLFANPNILKVAHSAGGGDVDYLYRDFGIFICGLFDTFIAAKALGYKSLSLVALLERYEFPFVTQMKVGKQTVCTSDWRLRPLNEAQLQYAVLDIKYLLPLCYALLSDLNIKSLQTNDLNNSGTSCISSSEIEKDDDEMEGEDAEADWEGWGITNSSGVDGDTYAAVYHETSNKYDGDFSGKYTVMITYFFCNNYLYFTKIPPILRLRFTRQIIRCVMY